jgi:hypothetical protein
MKTCLVLLFVSGVCLSGAALADDAALLHCRASSDASARLACYDAIPALAAGSAPAPAVAVASAPAQAAPAASPAAYVMPVPGRAEMEQMFGKEPSALQAYRLESFESRIDGKFDGWVAGQRIRLANGQVWAVVDGSDDLLEADNPRVTVKRGLLGAVFLDIEGAHRAPKVRRVQ